MGRRHDPLLTNQRAATVESHVFIPILIEESAAPREFIQSCLSSSHDSIQLKKKGKFLSIWKSSVFKTMWKLSTSRSFSSDIVLRLTVFLCPQAQLPEPLVPLDTALRESARGSGNRVLSSTPSSGSARVSSTVSPFICTRKTVRSSKIIALMIPIL